MDSSGGDSEGSGSTAKPKASKKSDDVVIEDLDDPNGQVNLDDIPF